MVAKAIRLLRQQRGWTQHDVAQRLEISIPSLSKIEAGITDLNLSRLNQIAELFNLTTVQLLSYSGSEEVEEEADKVKVLSEKIQQRDDEIIYLQKKVILLYEHLYSLHSSLK